jgi:hypothetical protein
MLPLSTARDKLRFAPYRPAARASSKGGRGPSDVRPRRRRINQLALDAGSCVGSRAAAPCAKTTL